MNDRQPSKMDLLIESHLELERQGPGSPDMTLKALSFVDIPNKNARVADLGCGTGGQTMILAQNTDSIITGVDMISDFIEIFNNKAKQLSLNDRVHGVVGSIEDLPFEKEELDLIWSEGVIDRLSFKKMLIYWSGFLKKDGYVVVTCPTWLSDAHPAEVEKFWLDHESGMDSIENNIITLRESGYQFTAAFTLPEQCWTNNYYIPREASEKLLLQKYPGNITVEEYVQSMKYEFDLYEKYKKYYGYAFYVGKKL